MKLKMLEDNLPDNVSWNDPNFYSEDPVYDPDDIIYAEIEYTGMDSDGDEFDDVAEIRKFYPTSGTFADAVMRDVNELVSNYVKKMYPDEELEVVSIGDITFVDSYDNKFDSSELP